MGSGRWEASVYAATTGEKVATGRTFGYSTSTRALSRKEWKAHETLDPTKVAGETSPFAGNNVRESRDSTEHPNSTPIAVFFDETGSMDHMPRALQKKLMHLFGLLIDKSYAFDPQIMIGAYGDAECDQVPLQVGEFESDNRIDDALDNLFLEGGGGGNHGESMAMAWYFLAHHTATDSWDKRSEKGYAFFIGDEVSLELTGDQVRTYLGDVQPEGPLDHPSLVASMRERWEPFVIVVDNRSAELQGSVKFYTDLFGFRNVLIVKDESHVTQAIALAIGIREGTTTLKDGIDDVMGPNVGEDSLKHLVETLIPFGTIDPEPEPTAEAEDDGALTTV